MDRSKKSSAERRRTGLPARRFCDGLGRPSCRAPLAIACHDRLFMLVPRRSVARAKHDLIDGVDHGRMMIAFETISSASSDSWGFIDGS